VIETALRRFGYAAERTLPEEEIVDLMIAAESLFLSDIGKRDRGELRHRLAMRAAALRGLTADERMQMSKVMRNAYDARSVIVHGGIPSENELRDLYGQPVLISHFTTELETTSAEGSRPRSVKSHLTGHSRRTGTS